MSELPMVKYTGKIREIKVGKPGCEVVVGGETTYNFYSFEGKNPNLPKLALQVTDIHLKSGRQQPLNRSRRYSTNR